MTSKTLAMFPGQGSQYVGMGKKLFELFPKIAKVTFEEAEDAVGVSLTKLCLEGPEDDLKLTKNTQPCLLAHSIATWNVLVEEKGFSPDVFAGHSLGEYSALVAANVLDLGRAAFLVRKRGEAMQEAVPVGLGSMAAVMNLAAEQLEALCSATSKTESIVQIANYNSPQQLVIAGHTDAVDRACDELEKQGVRFVKLAVSAPFHSKLMLPAREKMAPLLQESKFGNPSGQLIANTTGSITNNYDANFLIEQINSPVKWTQTLGTAHEIGCESFLEVGPGKVLFGLARKTLPRGLKLASTDDIEKALSEL